MRLIVSCFISLILLFNVGLAVDPSSPPKIALPNANSLFEDINPEFIEEIDRSLGSGLNALLLFLYNIGYGIALIVTIVIAIKLMLTQPSKKAEVKEALMPYLLGLLFLVAGVPIAIKVIELFTKIF